MGMDIYGVKPFPLKGKETQGKAAEEALNKLRERIGESFGDLQEEQKKAVLEIENIVRKYNPGEYFRANIWAWRPIHMLCETIISENELDIPTYGWEENSGYGIETQDKCDMLAKEIDVFLDQLDTSMLIHPTKETEDLRLYINMMVLRDDYTKPFGICYPDGKFIAAKDWNTVIANNYKKYLKGKVITHNLEPLEFKVKDKTVRSSYSVSYDHIKEFSMFLKHCGGFTIY
jgi:hypothetical protein